MIRMLLWTGTNWQRQKPPSPKTTNPVTCRHYGGVRARETLRPYTGGPQLPRLNTSPLRRTAIKYSLRVEYISALSQLSFLVVICVCQMGKTLWGKSQMTFVQNGRFQGLGDVERSGVKVIGWCFRSNVGIWVTSKWRPIDVQITSMYRFKCKRPLESAWASAEKCYGGDSLARFNVGYIHVRKRGLWASVMRLDTDLKGCTHRREKHSVRRRWQTQMY